jgi:hypothetical protein
MSNKETLQSHNTQLRGLIDKANDLPDAGGGGEGWIGDGKTHLWINIAAEGIMDVPLYFSQTVANGVTIDWGDGSATETLSGTGKVDTTHTYAKIGEYVISLDVADGCTLELGGSSQMRCIMGKLPTGRERVYSSMLKKAEVGSGVTSIAEYAFQYCGSLESVMVPEGVTVIESQAFRECCSLKKITIPKSVTSIGNGVFHRCYSLRNVTIPEGVTSYDNNLFRDCYSLESAMIPKCATSIPAYCLYDCRSLRKITIPESVTSIATNAFYNCYSLGSVIVPEGVTVIESQAFFNCGGMKFYDFTKHTAVPTLGNTNAFSGIASDCEIRVPAALYDEWISATNWSTYADKIVAV